MPGLNIRSEVGRLRSVVLHSPGPEVEAMTPGEAAEDLYNDIIPLGSVRAEHDLLKAFLASVCEVHELVDLLADCLAGEEERRSFLSLLAEYCPIRERLDELGALSAPELARRVIEGLTALPAGLARRVSTRAFSLRPLPNTYFMRDTAAVFRDSALSSAMAFDVRLVESLVTRLVLRRHPRLRARGILFDGPQLRNRFVTLEGGDLLVVSPSVLAIGVSERTSPEAIEAFARQAAADLDEELDIVVAVLPRERATIHLDMVFTLVDEGLALVHRPRLLGPARMPAVHIKAVPGGSLAIGEVDGLLEGLAGLGHSFEPILCGDGDPLYEAREQWLSGANSFAFAPGRILAYSCNLKTLDALARKGFEERKAAALIAGTASLPTAGQVVVTFDGIELARGGGGARCMTLPLERD